MGFAQAALQGRKCRASVWLMGNDFSDHRIIIGTDSIAASYAMIDTDILRKRHLIDRPRCWHKPGASIFGINPGFQRMAVNFNLLLTYRQRRAGSDFYLPFHQIKSGDHFCYGMFDLQAGIHFHKPEPVWPQPVSAIYNKFNCTSSAIADRLCNFYRRLCHRRSGFRRHIRGRGFFDNLLMASLQAAIPFK